MSDLIRNAVGAVLANASNFPENAQSRLLGQDMGPLIDQVTVTVRAALAEQGETEWEYGTARTVTDGWERGDRYGERQYIDHRSISDRLNSDQSTVTKVRDLTRAVRRRKAGPWQEVEQ